MIDHINKVNSLVMFLAIERVLTQKLSTNDNDDSLCIEFGVIAGAERKKE